MTSRTHTKRQYVTITPNADALQSYYQSAIELRTGVTAFIEIIHTAHTFTHLDTGKKTTSYAILIVAPFAFINDGVLDPSHFAVGRLLLDLLCDPLATRICSV